MGPASGVTAIILHPEEAAAAGAGDAQGGVEAGPGSFPDQAPGQDGSHPP